LLLPWHRLPLRMLVPLLRLWLLLLLQLLLLLLVFFFFFFVVKALQGHEGQQQQLKTPQEDKDKD
jgi:hypothetical protein